IQVQNLTKESTMKLLKTNPSWPLKMDIESHTRRYQGVGGFNVLRKKHFEAVGGFEERFRGWGGEDVAFYHAMNTLCGSAQRLKMNLFHLWHPPIKAKGNPDHRLNLQLAKRYRSLDGQPKRMRKIIAQRNQQ